MQKKIKVLWLINTVLPRATEAFHLNQNVYGGWLTALIKGIAEQSAIHLIVVFPNFKSSGVERAEKDGIVFYSVAMPSIHHRYHPETEIHFKTILKNENPDIVHIFGTEFSHALAMVCAFDTPKQTLIHIQGLCSFIALHYLDGIPAKVLKKKSLKELLTGKGMVYDQGLFYVRAKFETEALIRCGHVDGRTTWDKACALQINDALKYHYCSESLRDGFYQLRWDINQIERHTVFISQATYPLKGFHLALGLFRR